MSHQHPWRKKWTNRTPTKQQIKLAFAAQAPHNTELPDLNKPKRLKREDDGMDGIGGTDGGKNG
jgi:hypothetical protein